MWTKYSPHANSPHVILRERVKIMKDVTIPAVALYRAICMQSHLCSPLMLCAEFKFSLARFGEILARVNHTPRGTFGNDPLAVYGAVQH